jgi:hypothetical protein
MEDERIRRNIFKGDPAFDAFLAEMEGVAGPGRK